VLTRGDPVAIRVVNKLNEPTAIHWHGIELESYFDGVPGWGGDERQTTPMVLPGESFEARFTPPRAGTFIYHTHMKDLAQLSSGLYGPIIVLPPGEKFNSETDKIFVASRNGIRDDGQLLLNGISQPPAVEWKAGTDYRLRIINIGNNNTMKVTVTRDGKPVEWQHIAKDGADLPAGQAVTTPADLTFFPGETYDFRLRPDAGADLQFSVELALLKEKVTQTIHVK
jgi:FtsP/CotA-like multicopper oxidase with cupredoxin domain